MDHMNFNASSTSIIDILHSTGLFVKPIQFDENEYDSQNHPYDTRNKNNKPNTNKLKLKLFLEKKNKFI